MIATLKGTIKEKLLESVILDVNDIGYRVLITGGAYESITLDDTLTLYIYEHIRENAYDLYGFPERDTLALFEQLIAVNGVGPKVALNVLGVGSVAEVKQAIASGDIKLIQAAQGVGKRVAERIIIELKDKVGLLTSLDEQALLGSDAAAQKEEAVQALVSLGFSVSDAVLSLKGIDKELPTEERVTLALKAK